jgi:hypothetical protein
MNPALCRFRRTVVIPKPIRPRGAGFPVLSGTIVSGIKSLLEKGKGSDLDTTRPGNKSVFRKIPLNRREF